MPKNPNTQRDKNMEDRSTENRGEQMKGREGNRKNR
jgi:hypothetical protein